jgi:hypothetical protein
MLTKLFFCFLFSKSEILFFNFEIIYFSIIYYNIVIGVVKLFRSVAYDNYFEDYLMTKMNKGCVTPTMALAIYIKK